MSLIGEYLKLIPKFIKNPKQIVEGIINDVNLKHGGLDEDERNEIIRRRVICEGCPFMSENAKTNAAIKYESDRPDKHCIHCKCNIEWKTACITCNCGLEAHNKTNPDFPIALNWTRYIKKSNNQENGQDNSKEEDSSEGTNLL